MREGIAPHVAAIQRRSMYSKSALFEAGYDHFVADTLARGIQSVARVETDTAKMVVLAGCVRLVASKLTGLICMEELEAPYHGDGDPVWIAAELPDIKFWAGSADLKGRITNAWVRRLRHFVPSAKECYPALPEEGFYSTAESGAYGYQRSAQEEWEIYVDLAARRRVGSKVNTRAAVKTMVLGLWRYLVDEEVLRLCIAFFGSHAQLRDYNRTVMRRSDLAALESETPNLAPLIGLYIARHAKLSSGSEEISRDIVPVARGWFFGADLSPAAWRAVTGRTHKFVASVLLAGELRSDFHGDRAVSCGAVMSVLASAGEEYPLAFVMWWLGCGMSMSSRTFMENRDSFIRFVRHAGREAIVAKKKKRLVRFVRGDLVLAWDWMMGNERDGCVGGDVKVVQKNATWASIMRSQVAWHNDAELRERLAREANEREYLRWREEQAAAQWISALGPLTIDNITATPLTTGSELLEEDATMNHCVGDYIDHCVRGRSRIFHLASDTEVATLELVSVGRTAWTIGQVHGIENAESSSAMWKAAKEIAKRYAKAGVGEQRR